MKSLINLEIFGAIFRDWGDHLPPSLPPGYAPAASTALQVFSMSTPGIVTQHPSLQF